MCVCAPDGELRVKLRVHAGGGVAAGFAAAAAAVSSGSGGEPRGGGGGARRAAQHVQRACAVQRLTTRPLHVLRAPNERAGARSAHSSASAQLAKAE
jgi:hypothetical protein